MKTKTIQEEIDCFWIWDTEKDRLQAIEMEKRVKEQATLSQRQDDVKEFLKDLKEYRDNDTILIGHLVEKYEQEIKNG